METLSRTVTQFIPRLKPRVFLLLEMIKIVPLRDQLVLDKTSLSVHRDQRTSHVPADTVLGRKLTLNHLEVVPGSSR
jgi:hypothetical protein